MQKILLIFASLFSNTFFSGFFVCIAMQRLLLKQGAIDNDTVPFDTAAAEICNSIEKYLCSFSNKKLYAFKYFQLLFLLFFINLNSCLVHIFIYLYKICLPSLCMQTHTHLIHFGERYETKKKNIMRFFFSMLFVFSISCVFWCYFEIYMLFCFTALRCTECVMENFNKVKVLLCL